MPQEERRPGRSEGRRAGSTISITWAGCVAQTMGCGHMRAAKAAPSGFARELSDEFDVGLLRVLRGHPLDLGPGVVLGAADRVREARRRPWTSPTVARL